MLTFDQIDVDLNTRLVAKAIRTTIRIRIASALLAAAAAEALLVQVAMVRSILGIRSAVSGHPFTFMLASRVAIQSFTTEHGERSAEAMARESSQSG